VLGGDILKAGYPLTDLDGSDHQPGVLGGGIQHAGYPPPRLK
jgi:hypothetical protein